MDFPEQLYRRSGRDFHVTGLDPLITFRDALAATVVVETLPIAVPNDRVLLLNSACPVTVAGAGQTTTALSILLRAPTQGTPNFILWAEQFTTLQLQRFLNYPGGAVIPPSWSILAQGVFSAAVAANFVSMHLTGLLIPRANIASV